jgi:hypothetical protein
LQGFLARNPCRGNEKLQERLAGPIKHLKVVYELTWNRENF